MAIGEASSAFCFSRRDVSEAFLFQAVSCLCVLASLAKISIE